MFSVISSPTLFPDRDIYAFALTLISAVQLQYTLIRGKLKVDTRDKNVLCFHKINLKLDDLKNEITNFYMFETKKKCKSPLGKHVKTFFQLLYS